MLCALEGWGSHNQGISFHTCALCYTCFSGALCLVPWGVYIGRFCPRFKLPSICVDLYVFMWWFMPGLGRAVGCVGIIEGRS